MIEFLSEIHYRFRMRFAVVLVLSFMPVTAVADPPPIKLGATLALSGKLAVLGEAERQGLELAVADLNAKGGVRGRPLQLIVEDNGGDPKSALNSVNKLYDVDQIDFLISVFTHITQAVKDRAKRAGKIMLYHGGYGDIATENPLFFRDWGDAEEESVSVLKAVAERRLKRLAFLGETNDACMAFEKLIKSSRRSHGLEPVRVEYYTAGESDFKPMLLRLSQYKPDVLIACTWRDGALLMSHMKTLQLMHLPTYQTLAPLIPLNDTAEARALYEENGAVSVWFAFVQSEATKEQQALFSRLKERFRADPRVESVIAYDDVMMLAKATELCLESGVVDQSCVAKQLRQSTYLGVGGPICFDELGRSNRSNILMRVENGRWKKISEDGGVCPRKSVQTN